jgi:phospholipid transport system substrate-binding protein
LVLRILPALVTAALLLAAPAAQAAEAGARAIVERLNATLIEVMKGADALGYAGRYERLDPVLRESFDFPSMAGISVGRHWRTLDRDQRVRLVGAFARESIATFAERFDGYGGERFEARPRARATRSWCATAWSRPTASRSRSTTCCARARPAGA